MIEVTVKNKLGPSFGNRSLVIRRGNQELTGSPLSPISSTGLAVMDTVNDLETLVLEVKDAEPGKKYPQPKVAASLDVGVDITPASDGKKWRLIFHPETVDNLESSTASAPGGSTATVTVGQDEPESQILFFMSVLAGGISVGLAVGPFLQKSSPDLWVGLIALSAAVSFVTGLMAWRRRPNKREQEQRIEKGEELKK